MTSDQTPARRRGNIANVIAKFESAAETPARPLESGACSNVRSRPTPRAAKPIAAGSGRSLVVTRNLSNRVARNPRLHPGQPSYAQQRGSVGKSGGKQTAVKSQSNTSVSALDNSSHQSESSPSTTNKSPQPLQTEDKPALPLSPPPQKLKPGVPESSPAKNVDKLTKKLPAVKNYSQSPPTASNNQPFQAQPVAHTFPELVTQDSPRPVAQASGYRQVVSELSEPKEAPSKKSGKSTESNPVNSNNVSCTQGEVVVSSPPGVIKTSQERLQDKIIPSVLSDRDVKPKLDTHFYGNLQQESTTEYGSGEEEDNSDYEDTDNTPLTPPLPPPRLKPMKVPTPFTRSSSVSSIQPGTVNGLSNPPVHHDDKGNRYRKLPLPGRESGAPPCKPAKPPNFDMNSWRRFHGIDSNDNTYMHGATYEACPVLGTRARIRKTVVGGFRRFKKQIRKGK